MIEIKKLTASYSKNAVLDSLSLTAHDGEITAVLGRNGAGKTTLFNCISGAMKHAGEITVSGDGDMSRRLSFLRQNLPDPEISVRNLVSFGRNPYLNLFKKMKNSDEIIVDEAMKKCGIFELRNRNVKELSGGEKQKAYIAMTLAQETPNILLDEPMAHLDAKSASEIQDILSNIKKEKAVLVITHDIISALKNSDKIAILNNKKIDFAGTPEQCLESKAIEKAFGTQIVMFNDSGEKYYSLK